MGTAVAVGTLLLGGAGAKMQYDAASDAKNIANDNAIRQKAESDEAARRLGKQQDLLLSEAKARAFAGGSLLSSSTVAYMEEMKSQFKSEQDWIKKSGASAAYITRLEGKYQAKAGKAGAFGTLAGSAGNAYSAYRAG